jgi:hypothetical protein
MRSRRVYMYAFSPSHYINVEKRTVFPALSSPMMSTENSSFLHHSASANVASQIDSPTS